MKSNTFVEEVSDGLTNPVYRGNLEATAQVMNVLERQTSKSLTTVRDYVQAYDDSYYTYVSWDDLLKSEREIGEYGLTEQECLAQLGQTIFQLSCGWYVQKG